MATVVGDERDDIITVNSDRQQLSLSVNTKKTVGGGVFRRNEDGIITNPVSENTVTGADFEQEQETTLGDHENDTIFLRHLHQNGEIVGIVGRVGDFGTLLEFLSSLGLANFHNMESGHSFACLSFGEAEQTGLLTGFVNDSLTETSSVAFQELLSVGFSEVQLHITVDCSSLIGSVDGSNQQPILGMIGRVTNDLAIVGGSQLTVT
mmetsp:Transcript_27003/g.31127  ORF Transcript_27003/g.31127 Transcript_27003/m.31127 type:complete len:207 (-) Transcript_27003:376-996(-)